MALEERVLNKKMTVSRKKQPAQAKARFAEVGFLMTLCRSAERELGRVRNGVISLYISERYLWPSLPWENLKDDWLAVNTTEFLRAVFLQLQPMIQGARDRGFDGCPTAMESINEAQLFAIDDWAVGVLAGVGAGIVKRPKPR